ncbi:MAG: hypothetical protein U1G08_18065 [Verrucomicrobiota bacterium]
MTATPSEVSALVAAGWVPSRYSVWTASGEATLLRRGEETLHVIIVAEPEPAADKVELLLPADGAEFGADGVTLFIPSGPYWTSPEPKRMAPVATGSSRELENFSLGTPTRRIRRNRR